MTPLEKAVEASTRFSLTYSHDGWRLYDNDVRAEGPWSGDDYILAHEVLSTARAKAAIRAFLEAAAEDVAVKNAIGRFYLINQHDGWRLYESGKRIDGPWSKDEEEAAYEALDDAQAKAAILALKETING